ncbi:rho guanine nucleotide exchange factor 18a isoform X2 [Betta splendens]|nr:rho guanine nucleotide exchange factor 18a isoform X2 [Betta splendens]
MDEPDALRGKIHFEESVLLASVLAEPINLEDSYYVQLQAELNADAQNLEAESWSVAVDHNYVKALSKEAVKRQDVIYELMQTELNHVRTLKVLVHVYMHELRRSLTMEEAKLECLFPGVEALLSLHQNFLNRLKEHQNQCLEEGGPNYQITNLGEILTDQFSGSVGELMRKYYSWFCSHHMETVSFYKEQLQSNKKFQFVIKKIGQLPVVRRLGIPECFLLVTQRITKYPVLVERILENTEAETSEGRFLKHSLELIKNTISKVNDQVREYEKLARLSQRLDPKSQGRMKDGRLFRREDLNLNARKLLHEGTVTWKSSGKQRDVHAVLLSDVLLLLQEKDQKLVFAAMENNSPVISLQRLIVREVAHEDKALFLICACESSNPTMYEIHTSSKEECITWMELIRGAVDRCREDEEYSELLARLQICQDILKEKDDQIWQHLTEKQQVFAALYETTTEQESPYKDLQLENRETLLEAAITEVENLQNLLHLRLKDPNVTADTLEAGIERPDGRKTSYMYSDTATDLQFQDYFGPEESADYDMVPVPDYNLSSSHFPEPEVCDSVMKLAQLLYSLKAVAVQQDSQTELQRAFQSKIQQPTRHYSSVLLEQEKQRNQEKQKEEQRKLHKMQAQHQEEQQRWEEVKEKQMEQILILEAELRQRQEDCMTWEKKLKEESAELERQKEEHQQHLETLRITVKMVEKDKELVTHEKERLEKIKRKMSMSKPVIPNYDDPAQILNFSFRGSMVNGGRYLTSPILEANVPTPMDPREIPPKVPPRKESIRVPTVKPELPIHLISTTNQTSTATVRQRIPTKLLQEPPSKGKEKSLKKNKSHKRANSAASIDVNQVVPIRVTGKEGGSLRSTNNRSPPPIIYQPDIFKPPRPSPSVKSSDSLSTKLRNNSSDEPPPVPPPFPIEVSKSNGQKVIFL